MKTIKEIMKENEDKMTPMECIDEVISCLEMLYCEENNTRLAKELSNFSGVISVAYKEAKLLKTKLQNKLH